MNLDQLKRMQSDKGFIAALDQSGGSTPKALELYGVMRDAYKNDEEMFDLVHEMRKRIICDKAFNKERILAAILFKVTMNSKIDGMFTGDFLWENKGIVPILKVDEGLAERSNGVCLMKPMEHLDELLENARERHIFGTKMRSVIYEYNEESIKEVVDQQFDYAMKIFGAGFVPIIEPEVDIHAENKAKIEEILNIYMVEALKDIPEDYKFIFKLTLPEHAGQYDDLLDYPQTVRIVALSGGYSRDVANEKLKANKNIVASFSRALAQGLSVKDSDEDFSAKLDKSIEEIYQASI